MNIGFSVHCINVIYYIRWIFECLLQMFKCASSSFAASVRVATAFLSTVLKIIFFELFVIARVAEWM